MEKFVRPETGGSGSGFSLQFSRDPAQSLLYLMDGTNQRVWILRRKDLAIVDRFGKPGRQAGGFIRAHMIAIDSKSRLYTGEAANGRRSISWVGCRFIARNSPPPPPGAAPPPLWGNPSVVTERLAGAFEPPFFARGIMRFPALSLDHFREFMEQSVGPMQKMVEQLRGRRVHQLDLSKPVLDRDELERTDRVRDSR